MKTMNQNYIYIEKTTTELSTLLGSVTEVAEIFFW